MSDWKFQFVDMEKRQVSEEIMNTIADGKWAASPNVNKDGRRLMEAKDVDTMSPSELVLHRRRLAYGYRDSPVLAALMEEIE